MFNLGGVIGGLIVVGFNSTNTEDSTTDITYYAIAALMALGSFTAFVLVAKSPRTVVRTDQSRVPVDLVYKVGAASS